MAINQGKEDPEKHDNCKTFGGYVGRTVPYPQHLTIRDLIHEAINQYPEAIAYRYKENTLTYRQLGAKANALAEMMSRQGVTHGMLVPTVIANSLELPIAWLAVMKLGAAFVPFDPDWPSTRLQQVFDLLEPHLTLVETGVDLSAFDVNTLYVSSDKLPENSSFESHPIQANDLIYGFFTSGSTGLPKCALNLHGGVFNRFWYMRETFNHLGRKVVLQNSKHVFDSSVWQFLWPITEGGEVIIPESAGHIDLDKAIALIETHKVSFTDFVPSVFNVLSERLAHDTQLASKLGSLRRVLIGGEAINAKAVAQFRELLPQTGIVNTYGPTETSIGMVFHHVRDEDRDHIPLGSSIDNTFLLVLGENMKPVAQGQTGMFYVGGACMGAGYYKDEDRTRKAFIPNPFPNIPGDKLYCTGDLGYFRPDGLLEIVGRVDNQVKIGGVRIELGEVEKALLNHPAVVEAICLAVARDGGPKKLIGFVKTQEPTTEQALRAFLTKTLPRNSVPRKIQFVTSLPMNNNGKCDRRVLEKMYWDAMDNKTEMPVAATDLESRLVAWFAQFLERNDVTPDTDFFLSNGTSLDSIMLSLEIEKETGLSVDASDIYQNPTPRELAKFLNGERNDTEQIIDWDAEAKVEFPHRALMDMPPKPQCVFLTGATGFVGVHVLGALLQNADIEVACGVRSYDVESARKSLLANLDFYSLGNPSYATRIRPVLFDLAHDGLSLSPADRAFLTNKVDAFVHVGGMIDFLQDYAHHKRVNVQGTAELARLAMTGKPKSFHHVSTISVFNAPPNDKGGAIGEDHSLDPAQISNGGYGQSKWVAERILQNARAAGLPVTVYRLGEVGPSKQTGINNERALHHRLIQTCLILGVYPSTEFAMEFVPADVVGEFIAKSVLRNESHGKTFNVIEKENFPLSRLCEGLSSNGFALTEVSYFEFWKKLQWGMFDGKIDQRMGLLLPNPDVKMGRSSNPFPNHTQTYRRDQLDAYLQEVQMELASFDEDGMKAMADWYRKKVSA